MIKEIFAKPCVGAIIEKIIDGEKYILVQTRQKEDGCETNGMIEIPAGKIREYENVFSALRREVREETGLEIIKIYGDIWRGLIGMYADRRCNHNLIQPLLCNSKSVRSIFNYS